MRDEPADAFCGFPQVQHPQPEGVAGEGATQGEYFLRFGAVWGVAGWRMRGKLLCDVCAHALVGGCGGGEHGYARRQVVNEPTDAPVVGAKVVPPV